ncbi:MAG: hypothetical protein K9G76_09900 [Bacteroidales bacterium]|nr:hypothetical protein [Bacteroidales bacterium]MCF8404012.1 hypothetical protein [Bacteroidales bacterium]
MTNTIEKTKSFAMQTVSYGTPVGITAVSAVALYNQVTLLVNILIPTAILLVYGMVWALLEIQKARQEISRLTTQISNDDKKKYYLPNKLRYQTGDPTENEDWYFLSNYSETARKYEELIHLLSNRIGIQLSPAAKELLIIPILEQYQIKGELDYWEVENSLNSILRLAKNEPSVIESDNSNKRTTMSIIKAWWKDFCNIPPFCTKKDKNEKDLNDRNNV